MENVIQLNGKPYELPTTVKTVHELLTHLNLTDRIAVIEVNEEILSQKGYDKPINDKDKIEIIHFVGGG